MAKVEAFCTLFFSDGEVEKLSWIIYTCATRVEYELKLEDDEKVDLKINAK